LQQQISATAPVNYGPIDESFNGGDVEEKQKQYENSEIEEGATARQAETAF
jgi:hypothetical protein